MPDETSVIEDELPCMTVNCLRNDKKLRSQETVKESMFSDESFSMRRQWATRSNALEKYMNMQSV